VKNLNELRRLQLLIYQREMPAKDIARQMRSSVPTAYRRLRDLEAAGAIIATLTEPPNGATGPRPKKFVVIKKVDLQKVVASK